MSALARRRPGRGRFGPPTRREVGRVVVGQGLPFSCPCLVVALVLCGWLVGVARGQMAVGAFSVPSGSAESPAQGEHAWAVTPSTLSSAWGLWHIPPRVGPGAAEDGAVRIVESLERRPDAMAALGGRVWLAYAGMGTRPGYALLTAAVRPGPIEGTWYSGAGGRLAAGPFLATRGALIGLAAGDRGLVALLARPDGSLVLAWHERGRWRFVRGPALGSPPQGQGVGPGVLRPQAVGVMPDGVVLLAGVGEGRLALWRTRLPPPLTTEGRGFELIEPDALLPIGPQEPAEPEAPEPLAWEVQVVPWAGGVAMDPQGLGVLAGPVGIGQRLVLAVGNDADGLRVVEVEGGRASVLHQGPAGAVALMPVARRGVIVRLAQTPEGARGRAATLLELEEFSLDSGRVLYRGPAVFDGPVSASDLRLVMVLMVLLSAGLLLFIVRTSQESEPYIPPRGMALADPAPRFLAGMLDGLLALMLAGELNRLLPEGWLAIRVGAEAVDLGPLVLALALGVVGGGLLEGIAGRTPGKLIFGLRVCRSEPQDDRGAQGREPSVGIGPSLVRNAVKWLLPMVAFTGMLTPARRHRGDTMTGLGVVSEAIDEGS